MIKDKIKIQIQHSLASLRHRNFRLFWFGECISLIGTWMQSIGLAWLVVQLTDSAMKLGIVSMIQFLPMMLFSLFAGILVDKFPKRYILIFTQGALMILAIILGSLTYFNMIEYWHILILALFLGLINTIDVPARQSFFIELVGKEDLMNAIALNSGIFNLARIIGPAIGGMLIGILGIAACFFINGISYLAVIAGLILIKLKKKETIKKLKPSFKKTIMGIRQGIRYINRRDIIKQPLVLLAVLSLFVMNFNVMIPIFASQSLNLEATGFGFLMSSMALGSFLGSITLAILSKNGPKLKYMIIGSFGMSGFMVILGLESSYILACITLFILGFFTMMMASMINSVVQINSGDNIRGRVMSVYSLLLGGLTPIGAFYAGNLMEFAGAGICLVVSGMIGIIGSIYFVRKIKQVNLSRG